MVANIDSAARNGWRVPCLRPGKLFDSSKLAQLLRGWFNQDQFAEFRQHDNSIAAKQNLAMAMGFAASGAAIILPLHLPVLQTYALEDAVVEPVEVISVLDGAGELTTHYRRLRPPELFCFPFL